MARAFKINKFLIVRNIKFADCFLQSLTFIRFFYVTDDLANYEQATLRFLIHLQLVGFLIQLFVKFKKKLKIERFIYAGLATGWLFLEFFYTARFSKIQQFKREGYIVHFSTPDALVLYTGIAIAFWYFLISFRESKYLLGQRSRP